VLLLPCALFLYTHSPQGRYESTQWRGRALLGANEEAINIHDAKFMCGYILGCISAVIYFFALPPQIIKNVSRGIAVHELWRENTSLSFLG
jgi:hypothetical protein